MSSGVNAAGLIVLGNLNPNWKGGKIEKKCLVCKNKFYVRPGYTESK